VHVDPCDPRMDDVHRHHLLPSARYHGATPRSPHQIKTCNMRSRQQSGPLTGQAPASVYRTGDNGKAPRRQRAAHA
jgi:hypothetical protein